jgi:hypothetical protein
VLTPGSPALHFRAPESNNSLLKIEDKIMEERSMVALLARGADPVNFNSGLIVHFQSKKVLGKCIPLTEKWIFISIQKI